jgi:hypothetical protein
MKKITFLVGLLLSNLISAQTFSDNFDSYTAGQKLAQQSGGAWNTWSNAPGGTEDVLVSNANSVSPSNSLYFSSNVQGGGPVDIVKSFGVLNTGTFSLNMNMLVETNKAAYFNFQKTATIGQIWAADFNFNDNGTLSIVNQYGLSFETNYTQNTWFNFRIDINFNTNTWEVFIDDVSRGVFSNSENQIASINIYPVDQNTPFAAGFFIDDFEYEITPYTLPNLNAAVTLVSIAGTTLAGGDVTRTVKVRNLGTTTINSFDITCNYNGQEVVKNVTGLNLASLAETTINIDGTMTLIAGSNPLTATVSNVNGNTQDGDINDDQGLLMINPIVPAIGKVVVGEEGTGTWCGWCPRGAVFMDKMETDFGKLWAGIAVHNGDPMTVTTYDDGIGSLIGGYPSSLVDRVREIDPSQMEIDFLQQIQNLPKAILSNDATWNSATRTLTVNVKNKFIQAANSNYKLACVLTEDGVTGTTSGYNQTNYYSGGANGVMGGYETLPSPVPASQMVYDHVAREISPSFTGQTGIFASVVEVGDEVSYTFNFTLPASWDENKISIVSMLIDPNGKIDNAGKTYFSVALAGNTSDISLNCGASMDIIASSGVTTVPNLITNITQSTNCSNTVLNFTQSPPAGTPLVDGLNQIIILSEDACGNKEVCFKSINFTNDVGLNQISKNSVVSIYPNPVNDELNFNSKDFKINSIKIVSIDGKEVVNKKFDSKTGIINLSILNQGIYSVELQLENGSIHKERLLKK